MIRPPIQPEIVTSGPKWSSRPPRAGNPADEEFIDVDVLATWLDSKFEIPGLGIRFGLDAIFGLIPGFGDLITSLAALYILRAANRQGVPRVTQARMAANIAVDWLAGSVPLLGDAFDVFWKANQMNAALLRRDLASAPHERRKHTRRDGFFLALLIVLLVGVLGVAIATAWLIVSGLARWIWG